MVAQPLKRNLYTILAADVVGYSRIMGKNEEEAFRILRAHRAITDSVIELHNGRVFNAAGDSVLAAFDSPVEAVRAAVEIQDAISTRNLSLEEDQRLTFRIGVNLGDVIIKDSDLLGDAVNIAARLESQAEPGGLCISGTVYDQIVGKLDLQFNTVGELTLKNIQRPIRAYKFSGTTTKGVSADSRGGAAAARTRSPPWLLIGAGAGGAAAIAASAAFFLIDRHPPAAPIAAAALAPIAATAPPLPRRNAAIEPFDGIWTGTWCPREFGDRKAFCVSRVIRVREGKIEMESGQPGTAGYTKLAGTVSRGGEVEMTGSGIAGQAQGRGIPFSVQLSGRAKGDVMTTGGKFQNNRGIDFNLTRTQR